MIFCLLGKIHHSSHKKGGINYFYLKPKILFLVNKIYLDKNLNEGGVRNCTEEYINLLSTDFQVILFPVEYSKSLLYKIRIKLGINVYNDYYTEIYRIRLHQHILQNEIKFVFLNLANTMTFAQLIKNDFKDSVKTILCSHGNESGDFLHETFRFKHGQNWLKSVKNSFLFAKMIKKEVDFRLRFLDMVLTVSEVDEGIEKWLGAKNVFMVPRVVKSETVPWNPTPSRVGFLGDLSHKPNYEGVVSFCDSVIKSKSKNIRLRLLGNPEHIGNTLAEKYSFIEYCGFVPSEKIIEEVGSWSLFLNLVFYYSRGVSTKLAKGIGWGLPVLSTTYGNRGYGIPDGVLTSAQSPKEMVDLCSRLLTNQDELLRMRNLSIKLSENNNFESIMEKLFPILKSL